MASIIVRDVDFVPFKQNIDDREMDMIAKLSNTQFVKISVVAKDCGISYGCAVRESIKLVKHGIAEVEGSWIKLKQKG